MSKSKLIISNFHIIQNSCWEEKSTVYAPNQTSHINKFNMINTGWWHKFSTNDDVKKSFNIEPLDAFAKSLTLVSGCSLSKNDREELMIRCEPFYQKMSMVILNNYRIFLDRQDYGLSDFLVLCGFETTNEEIVMDMLTGIYPYNEANHFIISRHKDKSIHLKSKVIKKHDDR